MSKYISRYTGTQIDNAVDKVLGIKVNSGEPATDDMQTLKVGDVVYGVGGSASSGVYAHRIIINGRFSDNYNEFTLTFILCCSRREVFNNETEMFYYLDNIGLNNYTVNGYVQWDNVDYMISCVMAETGFCLCVGNNEEQPVLYGHMDKVYYFNDVII